MTGIALCRAAKTLDMIIAGEQPIANVETQVGSNGKKLSIVPISLGVDTALHVYGTQLGNSGCQHYYREEKRMNIIAIDAGGTFFKSALVSEQGEIPECSRIVRGVNYAGSIESIRCAYQYIVEKQLNTARLLAMPVAGVCIDTPGPFDFEAGISRMQHKFRAIFGIPLRPWIEEKAGELPVIFIHDSTAFLLGESWRGCAAGQTEVAGVMLGTGLGFAAIHRGQILLNSSGGPRISIYNKPFRDATAEDYVSRRGIIARYCSRTTETEGDGVDVIDIARLAKSGRKAAIDTFIETGSLLGEIIAPTLCELKTDTLVLGGQISKSFDLFEESLRKSLKNTCVRDILCVQNPDDSHLLGCAQAFFGR